MLCCQIGDKLTALLILTALPEQDDDEDGDDDDDDGGCRTCGWVCKFYVKVVSCKDEFL